MAALSDVDIKKIITENKGIIIMNMHDNNLTALGYDFTIGFICDSDTGDEPKKIECICDTESDKEYIKDNIKDCQLKEEIETDKKRYKTEYRYKLEPGKRYLVISEEYIALLKKYMATLHSRGSYALKGIIVTSTTIDPNYMGFIYASLMNCSTKPVYIKEHNQFATMVIQTLTTATDKSLPKTERGMPKDAEQTLNGKFSNICEEASTAAKTYRADAWKRIQGEFQDKYADFEGNSSDKTHFVDWFFKIIKFLIEKVFSKWKFWMGIILVILTFLAYKAGGMDKVIELIRAIRQ